MRKKKIIGIFEDIQSDRFLYHHFIDNLPNEFTCYLFHTPEQGCEMVQKIPFDAIFINIHFWGTHFGLELYEKLRKHCADETCFIAVTPFIQSGDLEKLKTLGINQCYEKPAVFTQLLNIISRNCAVQSSHKHYH